MKRVLKSRMGKWMTATAVLLAAAGVQAAEIVVSWESNGMLVAEGMEPGTACSLEWSTNLLAGFTNGNLDYGELKADGNGKVSVETGTNLNSTMFFRMSGTPVEFPPEGMVLIPAGTNVGTNPLDAGESYSADYPKNYSLTVDEFCIDATEVTYGEWEAVYSWAMTNGYSFVNVGSTKGQNYPVHAVDWYDCVKWCNARSEKEGRTPCYTVGGSIYKTGEDVVVACDFAASGYRLPTITEWEYAARGGLSGKRFPWGDTITHSEANYRAHFYINCDYDISPTSGHHPGYDVGGTPYTSPVGSFAPNGYGLYDMCGNVSEWCWGTGYSRTMKGGSYDSPARGARCGDRDVTVPIVEYIMYGFRTVLSANY